MFSAVPEDLATEPKNRKPHGVNASDSLRPSTPPPLPTQKGSRASDPSPGPHAGVAVRERRTRGTSIL